MIELPVVFFTFANDPYHKLLHLSREEDGIHNALLTRAKKSHFFLDIKSIAEKEHLTNAIRDHWKEIVIFHFSGHANLEELAFSDAAGKVKGLHQLLKLQSKIQLIFLNGCSTYGHVKAYLEAGVPVVIATDAPVNDKVATDFSISFYEALSLEGMSILEAFQLAKAKVAFLHEHYELNLFQIDPAKESNRAAEFNIQHSDNTVGFNWGLYYQDEQHLHWTLPYRSLAVNSPAKRIDLTEVLSEAFFPYCREIRLLQEREEEGEMVNPGEFRDNIIKCLPSPLGLQVRKVFAQMPDNFAAIEKKHIRQIFSTYSILIEFIGFTMMAQLWEACLKSKTEIPAELKMDIQYFLTLNLENRKLYDFFRLIQSICQFFHTKQIDSFIEELEILNSLFTKDQEFIAGRSFMESTRWLMANKDLDIHALPNNYLLAEEHLAKLLDKLGFCAKYRLTVVKNINLIQPRHKAEPVFVHTQIPLIACGTYDATPRPFRAYAYSRSVIMLKSPKKINEFLTLSPFIIDKNAYDNTSRKSNIFFFSHYDRQEQAFIFKNTERPQEKLVIAKTDLPERKLTDIQQYHNEIIEQFEAFVNLVFQYPIDQL